jgi:hypothetical protein
MLLSSLNFIATQSIISIALQKFRGLFGTQGVPSLGSLRYSSRISRKIGSFYHFW